MGWLAQRRPVALTCCVPYRPSRAVLYRLWPARWQPPPVYRRYRVHARRGSLPEAGRPRAGTGLLDGAQRQALAAPAPFSLPVYPAWPATSSPAFRPACYGGADELRQRVRSKPRYDECQRRYWTPEW